MSLSNAMIGELIDLNLHFSCLNSANLMTCISKQTKVLEAAVRELRGELSTRCEQNRNNYSFRKINYGLDGLVKKPNEKLIKNRT